MVQRQGFKPGHLFNVRNKIMEMRFSKRFPIIIIILSYLFLNSCSHLQTKQPADPIQAPSPAPIVEATPTPSPAEAKKPSIVYEPIDAMDSELPFIHEGERQANAVLASDCLKNEVIANAISVAVIPGALTPTMFTPMISGTLM